MPRPCFMPCISRIKKDEKPVEKSVELPKSTQPVVQIIQHFHLK